MMSEGSSFFGFFLLAGELFVESELAALNGDQNVGVLRSRRHELRYDILRVLRSPHTQRLESLQTVLVINVELLQGESSVLHQVREEGSILNRLDHLNVSREVLDRDAYWIEKTFVSYRKWFRKVGFDISWPSCKVRPRRQDPSVLAYHRS